MVDLRPVPPLHVRLLVVWIALAVLAGVIGAVRHEPDEQQRVAVGTLPTLPEVPVPSLPPVTVTVPPVPLPPGTVPPVTVPPVVPKVLGLVDDIVEQVACAGDVVPVDHNGLWLVDADRSCARVVMRGLEPGTPAFSPDGRFAIAAAKDSDEPFAPSTLWKVDLTTGARRPLVPSALGLGSVAWSPDGAWISYTSFPTEPPLANPTGKYGPSASSEVWLVRPDGSSAHRIAAIDGWGLMAWAPDGHRLAVTLKNDRHVLIYDLATGTERRFPVDRPYLATWSPDGAELLIDGDVGADDANDSTTYRMDPSTGDTKVWGEHLWFPRWSPQGDLVAVYLGYRFGDQTQIRRRDGSVVQGIGTDLPLNWSTDGRYLLTTNGAVWDRTTGQVRTITVPGGDHGPWPQASRWIPGTHTFAVVATDARHYSP
jgi:dipeptidyl aminopeptidase/acylaminoacyl peptidase